MRKRVFGYLFWISIFVAIFIFFAYAHPYYIFDADDWFYISGRRWGIPLWGYWNPTRVLPETIMSYTGDIGAWLIKPFVKDYLVSITVAWALLMATLVMVYIREFYLLILNKFNMNVQINYLLSLLFLIFHFLIFKKQADSNAYMFHSQSLTIYFYYTIPNILNAILVLHLMRVEWREFSYVKKGIIFLIAYLCVFSNLFQSFILVSYVSYNVLGALICLFKRRKDLKTVIAEFYFYIYVMVLWVIQCIYDFWGGRASELKSRVHIIASLESFFGWARGINYFFLIIALSITATFVIVYIWREPKSDTKEKKIVRTLLQINLYCFLLSSLFLIALCSVVSSGYIERADVIFGVAFYFLLCLMNMIAYLLKKEEGMVVAIPLLLFVMLTVTTNGLNLFADHNIHFLRGKECLPISKDIVNQVLECEDEGYDTITLRVPVWEGNDGNWPHDVNCLGQRLANTLYRHGMTNRLMNIKIYPDINYKPSDVTEAYDKRCK